MPLLATIAVIVPPPWALLPRPLVYSCDHAVLHPFRRIGLHLRAWISVWTSFIAANDSIDCDRRTLQHSLGSVSTVIRILPTSSSGISRFRHFRACPDPAPNLREKAGEPHHATLRMREAVRHLRNLPTVQRSVHRTDQFISRTQVQVL